jgi:hypothetical protein
MWFFSDNKKKSKVQSLVLKLVNNHCPALRASTEDARVDSRVNLSIAAWLVPIQDSRLQLAEAFKAVTKDFSSGGISIVVDRPRAFEQAVLALWIDGEMAYILCEATHLSPMGGGFFQIGLRLLEVVSPYDYPGLENLWL